MVLVLAFRFDIQIHLGGIAQGFEEMQEHFCRHLTNLFTIELCIPYQPGASTEVQANLAKAVIHRQGIAITLDATFVSQCLIDAIA